MDEGLEHVHGIQWKRRFLNTTEILSNNYLNEILIGDFSGAPTRIIPVTRILMTRKMKNVCSHEAFL